MKKFLIAGAALTALVATPALAADMPLKAPAVVAAAYDWSGFYLGVNGGESWTRYERDFPYTGAPFLLTGGGAGNHSLSRTDGILGGQIGVQKQWGNIVVGIEASGDICFNLCTAKLQVGPPAFGAGSMSIVNQNGLLELGGRLGYAQNNWLFYATGGGASTRLEDCYGSVANPVCGAATVLAGASRNTGYYAGGGVETVVAKGPFADVILGIEYQHWAVSTKDAVCFNTGCNPRSGGDDTLSARGDLVRARLSVKTEGFGFVTR
jgi:outer membrane immunogenic protein